MKTERIRRQMDRLWLWFLVLVLQIILTGSALADIIPSSRTITWQGKVGVTGGIPNRTIIYATLGVAGQSPSYAQSVTASQINTALSNCPSGQVVYLNSGTYTVTSSINIQSNKTLRGAGKDATIIQGSFNDAIIYGRGGYTDCSTGGIDVTSGYTKGSTQIVLSSASTISVGDYLYLDELNDSTIPVNPIGTGGSAWYSSCFGSGNGSNRNRAQIVKVTNKSTNTLTFDPPMYFTFSPGNSPKAYKTPTYVEYAGVENLTVKRAGTNNISNIEFQGAANCWLKNIKVENLGKRGINFYYDNFRNEIRDSYFTGCIDQYNSDTCYGVQLSGSSGILVENNIFHNTANGIVLVASSGNVLGYNYMHGVHRTASIDSWFWPDTWAHGSHSSYNLWEGNTQSGINWDNYWGSNSHNTVFRSRIYGKDPTVTYSSIIDMAAVIDSQNNNYMTLAGNVLGTAGWSGAYEEKNVKSWNTKAIYATGVELADPKPFLTQLRHMNYDYFTNSIKYCDSVGEPGCQSGDGSHTLPNSLYLASKPSFFGNCSWPSIGPDLSPMENTLPAKDRYEGGSLCQSNPVAPQSPGNLRLLP